MPMYGQPVSRTLTRSSTRRPGEINSEVSIHSSGRQMHSVRWKSDLARVDGDNYIPRIMWMGEQNRGPDGDAHEPPPEQDGAAAALIWAAAEMRRQQAEEECCLLEEAAPTHVPVQDNFTFLSRRVTFLMTSMKDGYNHLYRVRPGNGRSAKQLTTGAWDITSVHGYDAKRKVVYYSPGPWAMGATQQHDLAKVDLRGRMTQLDDTPPARTACQLEQDV